jgi:Transposase, Mutator family/Calcineurin-like phosphoesterase
MPARGEIVIGDVHARPVALWSLLLSVGVVGRDGRRERSWSVVQLGDLLDRHASVEANLQTALLAAEAVDVVLAGNHESRMLAEPGSPHGQSLAALAAQGWPHAAAACGDWLVTHAGVHPKVAGGLGKLSKSTASRICEELKERFAAFKRRSLYDTQLVALFLDATFISVRPSGPKEGVLVAWGFTEQGERVLLSVLLGMRESHEDWQALGRDLIARPPLSSSSASACRRCLASCSLIASSSACQYACFSRSGSLA